MKPHHTKGKCTKPVSGFHMDLRSESVGHNCKETASTSHQGSSTQLKMQLKNIHAWQTNIYIYINPCDTDRMLDDYRPSCQRGQGRIKLEGICCTTCRINRIMLNARHASPAIISTLKQSNSPQATCAKSRPLQPAIWRPCTKLPRPQSAEETHRDQGPLTITANTP